MSLDDDYEDLPPVAAPGLKKVSSRKSIFDGSAKKPSPKDLEKHVKDMQERDNSFKQKTSDLAVKYKKILEDKTLPSNKSIFAKEMENEVLSSIVQLAQEVNSDPDEDEGIGSLAWIAQLLKVNLSQRDRMNRMEYAISQLEEKVKNNKVLDTSKQSG